MYCSLSILLKHFQSKNVLTVKIIKNMFKKQNNIIIIEFFRVILDCQIYNSVH